MRRFCRPERKPDAAMKPVFGVLVSAPVAYDPRAFILHLFSAVCRTAIESFTGTYASPETTLAAARMSISNSLPIRIVAHSRRLMMGIG